MKNYGTQLGKEPSGTKTMEPKSMLVNYPIESMYAIYANMDPINIPQSC